jgi:hypothetical protein
MAQGPEILEGAEMTENVDHPKHYNSNKSGIECIDVVEWMDFNIGTAMKYLWRCGHKGDAVEDLQKARWYIDREIDRRINDARAARPTDPADPMHVPARFSGEEVRAADARGIG